MPAHVTWIKNTASDMSSIETGVADVLFSGQNLEHLWADEVVGFLLESWRVLELDGLLVLDSPNRDVTSRLGWSHPEHTIELTPGEILDLLFLAGFDVVDLRGVWLCSDPDDGHLLGFAEMTDTGEWTVKSRMEMAVSNVEHSFIWWAEARRSDRVPDEKALRDRVSEIFAEAWPERVRRVKTDVGRVTEQNEIDSLGNQGAVMYGPYMPLPAGRYVVSFDATVQGADDKSTAQVVRCDVVDGKDTVLVERMVRLQEFADGPMNVELDFELSEMTFGLQFRLISMMTQSIQVDTNIRLRSYVDDIPSVV